MKRLWTIFVLASLVLPCAAGSPEQSKATMSLTISGKGEVVIELYPDKAPKAVAHITALADQGFYNGQKFFRVIKDPRPFLVLFGDPQTKSLDISDPKIGEGGSGKRIAYENSGVRNKKGAVGLSTKAGDKNGGDSQFYILLDDKPFLDGTYTVFGQVTKGMDIVSHIEVGDQVTSASVTRG